MTAPSHMREAAREMRRQGLPLSKIAEACGVTKVCASLWCRDLPEHRAAADRNGEVARRMNRLYPAGTEAFATKLRKAGVQMEERLKLVRELAEDLAEAGGRA